MSLREQNRERLKARIALNRMKQSTDAINKVVDVLAELPDYEMRRSVIEYLHKQLQRTDDLSPAASAE